MEEAPQDYNRIQPQPVQPAAAPVQPKADRIVVHNKALLTDFDQVSTLKKDNVNVLLNQMKDYTEENLDAVDTAKQVKPRVSQLREYSSEI